MNTPATAEVVGRCPRCGKPVTVRPNRFACTDPDCRFSLWQDDRFFANKHLLLTKEMAAELLNEGRIHLTGLISRKGTEYDADVVLVDDGIRRPGFAFDFSRDHKTEKGDLPWKN